MQKQAIIVCPKFSSYEFSSEMDRAYKWDTVIKYYELFKKLGVKVECFAEDMIAIDILSKKEDVIWLSTVSDGDRHFMKTNVDGYPKAYWDVQKDMRLSECIKKAVSRFKPKMRKECIDEEEYAGQRLRTINSRIKFVTEMALKSEKIIVYLSDNNNYCRLSEPEMGDGKLVVVINLNNRVSSFYYGGVPLNESDFNTVLRSVVV